MELIRLNRAIDSDGEFLFAELAFSDDGDIVNAICIEANELRLLVNSEMSVEDIVDEMEFGVGPEFEIETVDAQGNITNAQQTIDIEALLAYFMESDMERYECWKADLGEEGLCEAEESEAAVPLFLAYDYLRSSSADNVYRLLESAESDTFFEEFDTRVW